MLVGLECPDEVLEEILGVALGVFHSLEKDDPPLQRYGQGREFEVGAERATVVADARKRFRQGGDIDGDAVGQLVERALSTVKATISGRNRLPDRMNRRVQSERHAKLPLIQEDRSCLVDGIAATVQIVALVIERLLVQLLE